MEVSSKWPGPLLRSIIILTFITVCHQVSSAPREMISINPTIASLYQNTLVPAAFQHFYGVPNLGLSGLTDSDAAALNIDISNDFLSQKNKNKKKKKRVNKEESVGESDRYAGFSTVQLGTLGSQVSTAPTPTALQEKLATDQPTKALDTAESEGKACPACLGNECNTNTTISGIPAIQILIAGGLGVFWALVFFWLFKNFVKQDDMPSQGGYGYGGYSSPSSSYGAPQMSYGAPSTSYGTPSSSYGSPSRNGWNYSPTYSRSLTGVSDTALDHVANLVSKGLDNFKAIENGKAKLT